MRSQDDVDAVQALTDAGASAKAIARSTGIPRSTVRDWRSGRVPRRQRPYLNCLAGHLEPMDRGAYAYLLGMYLGDGCISEYRRVTKLRITLDATYQGIIAECATAIEAVLPGKRAGVYARADQRSVEVSSYWNHWPCLFPQHGRGPKHLRPIILTEWQNAIVAEHVERFVRGLIHSDGCRIIATERKGNYVRRAPRYAFTNMSEDILELFRAACEAAGVHCTRSNYKQISVYSKAAVARLDEFVGPKR